jgi:hypothetical protein
MAFLDYFSTRPAVQNRRTLRLYSL